MNFTPVILAEAAASGSTSSAMLSMLITFVPLFAVFYFLIVRPQKKREKEEKEMRESISIGDEIVTIGGIIGLVVRQTDDTLVIETGGDRSKLRIQKSAVKENVTARERMQAAAVEEKKNAGPDKTEKSKKES
ncbi:MAG: preprotein translocase subunit YajC [Oscillospiraceae bacterium]|nr:preprotein translocase subunit YajC [Oscillospiraceae bacterium]MBR6922927.1 preprotein translocase subunit YajC [Oscillospiraceae bacterium]